MHVHTLQSRARFSIIVTRRVTAKAAEVREVDAQLVSGSAALAALSCSSSGVPRSAGNQLHQNRPPPQKSSQPPSKLQRCRSGMRQRCLTLFESPAAFGGSCDTNLNKMLDQLRLPKDGSNIEKQRRLEQELRCRHFEAYTDFTPSHADVRTLQLDAFNVDTII